MASLKVAVRVRPLNQRETDMGCNFIIEMDGKKTTVQNPKAVEQGHGEAAREYLKSFTYDHSYWSVDSKDPKYKPQSQVFKDLGMDVIKSAYEGYNACVFAYGQTGSGKTYTMTGSSNDLGLTPRICEALFARMHDKSTTYRTEVSYLEIYNERVRDLIKTTTGSSQTQHSLRVREHPKEGPYVQDLSKHIVMDYNDIKALMDRGNIRRTTASTNMNDVSSRSHAIFTINFTQAKFSSDAPSETHSKIHLVDLAGSERADATGATGQRLKEGGSINKSLVTLGNVISTLADMSEKGSHRRNVFIPYRDSVLTWLLKDSLGGNAKTIMIATISPADCNYAETLSTLRYANRAKNIINKPTINEDPNVRLIKDLRAEISRLKTLLGGKADNIATPKVQEKLHENEARVKILTDEWTGKWSEVAQIMQEEQQLALRKEGLGVVLDSDLPHIIGIDDDILSTGIMLYHIKTGRTTIGRKEAAQTQDIVLQGEEVEEEHCIIEHDNGEVTLIPVGQALCTVNGVRVEDPVKLNQGAVILLGKTNMFRFNHPDQAAKMRATFNGSSMNVARFSSLSQSMSDLARSTENLALLTSGWEMDQRHHEQLEALEEKRQKIEEMEEQHRLAEEHRIEEQASKEQDLEGKKLQLENMQAEMEAMRKEAQEMKQAMDVERAKLKRRSMDIEKQYQQMLARQQQQEQVKELETEEKSRQRELLQQEINLLLSHEKEKVEEIKKRKTQLEESIKTLQSSKQNTEAEIEMSIKELRDIEEEMLKRREESAVIKEKDLAFLEKEREHLDLMRKDHEAFYKYTKDLDITAKRRLEAENERVSASKEELASREKTLYDAFKKEQAALENRKVSAKDKIERDREQLKADKIYLDDCEQQFQVALSQVSSEEEKEQLEIERVAIESERQRMKEDEEKIVKTEKEMQEEFEKEEEALRQKRDQQVESLQELREKYKQSEEGRRLVLEEEIRRNNERLQQVQTVVEEGELHIQLLEEEHAAARQAVEAATAAGDRDPQLNEKKVEAMQKSITELDEDLVKGHQRISDLEEGKMMLADGEDEAIAQIQQTVREIRGGDSSLNSSDSSPDEDKKSNLQQRILKLASLEEELLRSEEELELKRLRYEQERQEELDNIDWERFKLQEMEEVERIEALVEQEVKRRLLEERVQREKQRRIERELEKVEREQELTKLKRQHERELQRLKEKYESRNGIDIINSNLPTKANPYASVMTPDTGCFPRSRSIQSLEQAGPSQQNIHEAGKLEVNIPGFRQRGSALDTHYEFEIKIVIGQDAYSVFRRYTRFRDLHNDLKAKFPQIAALVFPPKKFFGNRSEKVVSERRKHLENYLINVLEILRHNTDCILHSSHNKVYSKQILHELHPFFKKGLFEVSKHGTA